MPAADAAAKSQGKLAISSGVGAAVSSTGPSFVTAIVCSKWALGLRSSVDWVQWSRMHLHALGAHVHHWLDGDHQARLDAEVAAAAQRAAEEIRHLRLFVHLPADAVADEAFDGREAVVANELGHFAGDLAPAALGVHQLERQIERGHR